MGKHRHAVIPAGPDVEPYIVQRAVAHLDAVLARFGYEAEVFEWGSGHSTIWLAKRCRHIVTVEHRQEWAEEVLKWADVEMRLVSLDDYVGVIDDYGKFDMVFIDGHQPTRQACAFKALEHLRPGGVLVLDDSHWGLWRRFLDLRVGRFRRKVEYRGIKNGERSGTAFLEGLCF